MDDAKLAHFKHFIRQKGVLDTLRTYLDLSDEFLRRMRQADFLTNEQLDTIEDLRWPQNRSELLRLLVKHSWDAASCQSFCEVLRDTQNEQLNTLVTDQAMEARQDGTELTLSLSTDTTTDVDAHLGGLSLQDRNHVRTLLKEREDGLRKLASENETLRAKLKTLSEEHHCLKYQYRSLDKAAEDVLGILVTDKYYDTVVQGLTVLREAIISMQSRVEALETDKHVLVATEGQLRDTISMLTGEGINLKSQLAAVQHKLDEARQRLEARVRKLEEQLHLEQTKRTDLERLKKTGDEYLQRRIEHADTELSEYKGKLASATRQLKETIQARNKAKEEVAEVNDKTRKLLSVLQLNNEVGKMGMSIEHARNLMYARKRQTVQWNSNRASVASSQESARTLSMSTLPSMNSGSHTDISRASTSLGSAPNELMIKANKPDLLSSRGLWSSRTSLDLKGNIDFNPGFRPSKGGHREMWTCMRCGRHMGANSDYPCLCDHNTK